MKRHLLGLAGATLTVVFMASAWSEATTSGSVGATMPQSYMPINKTPVDSMMFSYLEEDVIDGSWTNLSVIFDQKTDSIPMIAVPEPGALTLIAIAGILSVTKRRRATRI